MFNTGAPCNLSWEATSVVLGVMLVNAILPNIYQVLGIGFPKVLSSEDLSNLKALIQCPLSPPPDTHTVNKACYLGRVEKWSVGTNSVVPFFQYHKPTKACWSVGVQGPYMESSH